MLLRRLPSLFIFLLLISTGCAHFGDDITAYNPEGKWYDLGYKLDLAWNQGGPPLEVLATSQDGDLRRRALLRLTEPSNEQERAQYIEILSTAARTERAAINRLTAVQMLSTYKDPAATQALLAAYQVPANANDKNGVIQVAIVQALGKQKDPAALDILVAALDPKNQEDLRAAAAHSLRKYPEYKASEALLATLKQEKSTAVRREAHRTLVYITGRDLPDDPQVWEQTFQQAATRGEPLAKEPGLFFRLANWWSD
ncbi:MAG TPA: HEAT repeat domain-containing protein [Gemmatales bacterium]|nr:HEAT repeat domain-containing protein [Gemmatales bacterium]